MRRVLAAARDVLAVDEGVLVDVLVLTADKDALVQLLMRSVLIADKDVPTADQGCTNF